jgi:hypothetical protein
MFIVAMQMPRVVDPSPTVAPGTAVQICVQLDTPVNYPAAHVLSVQNANYDSTAGAIDNEKPVIEYGARQM